jgi:2-methylcitrate dehydratase PrpD
LEQQIMSTLMLAPPPVTRRLAEFACLPDPVPEHVRAEATRAFVNWMGCVTGGCREPAVDAVIASLKPFAGPPSAAIIGHGFSLDMLTASYVNCMSSGIHTYDDTYLKTVTHPTGPVASALFALAEHGQCRGEPYIAALAVGLEIACRLSSALFEPPAQCHLGLSMTGLTCGIGAAASCGRLLGLHLDQMVSALGIAATQAAGFRETHQSGAAYLLCAQAARGGLLAAVMASRGLTCTSTSLEGRNGFLSVFASPPNPEAAVHRLSEYFEISELAYKPYPCGIVVHPSIDVCLEAAGRLPATALERVELTVSPMALALARQSDPLTAFEAQVSLHHWAAAALLRKAAGLEEGQTSTVLAEDVVALRRLITVKADAAIANDEARGHFVTRSGETFDIHVPHCRGSLKRPMSDDELGSKFLAQAERLYSSDRARALLDACRQVQSSQDVGGAMRKILTEA